VPRFRRFAPGTASATILGVLQSRAGMWFAAGMALMAVTVGRAEGQGLPVRADVGVSANVLPLPTPQVVALDTLRAASSLRRVLAPADSTLAQERRQRRLVIAYPGT
jgi:hypothetical protein